MAFRNATIINNIVHQDSHKIFEAYVLAKSVEKQQLNEGVLDFLPGFLSGKENLQERKKRIFNTYKDLWTSYWDPRFENKNDLTGNPEKAVSTFEKFLNSRRWANPEVEKNKEEALKYYTDRFGKELYDDVENTAIKILLYGSEEAPTGKIKQTRLKPTDAEYRKKVAADTSKALGKEPVYAYKSIDLSKYSALKGAEKEAFDKKFAKKEDFDKTVDHAKEEPAPEPTSTAEPTEIEPEEDIYKLKGDITRWKKQNERWIRNIKKKFGVKVRKPSDLLRKK